MAERIRVNFLEGTLSSAITAGDTSLTCTALAYLPTVADPNIAVLTIEAEIVKVTAHTAGESTATISRAFDGTTAAAHAAGAVVAMVPVESDLPWVGTDAEYAALSSVDPTRLYITTG